MPHVHAGTFRPARVAHIAETRFGLDPEAVLDNIVYCRCYTHEQQMERVMQIPDVVVDDGSPFRVVVRRCGFVVASASDESNLEEFKREPTGDSPFYPRTLAQNQAHMILCAACMVFSRSSTPSRPCFERTSAAGGNWRTVSRS